MARPLPQISDRTPDIKKGRISGYNPNQIICFRPSHIYSDLPSNGRTYGVSQNLPQIYPSSGWVYNKSILKQMQYRFTVNFGTLSAREQTGRLNLSWASIQIKDLDEGLSLVCGSGRILQKMKNWSEYSPPKTGSGSERPDKTGSDLIYCLSKKHRQFLYSESETSWTSVY